MTTGFTAPLNLSAVNSASPEAPTWVSADGCVLYLQRDVGLAAPNTDLYVATKPL